MNFTKTTERRFAGWKRGIYFLGHVGTALEWLQSLRFRVMALAAEEKADCIVEVGVHRKGGDVLLCPESSTVAVVWFALRARLLEGVLVHWLRGQCVLGPGTVSGPRHRCASHALRHCCAGVQEDSVAVLAV